MTNNLTNGISRLSEEISALRHNRAALTSDLVLGRSNLGNAVSEMIAGFKRDREEMGEKTKSELSESVSNVKDSVASLRQNVGDLRAKFASDMVGARTAWSGPAAERTIPRVASAEH